MQFHAYYFSACIDGDYYTAMFAGEKTDGDRPYLTIQRQFEYPEDETRYIETHDREYSGHFLALRVESTPESLLVELNRPCGNLINVTFHIAPPEF